MAHLDRITPFVPVSNMIHSIDFFRDILGFSVGVQTDSYAFVFRDAIAIRLVSAHHTKDMKDPNSQQHCYVDVLGIDDLYQELKPGLDKLPQGRVKAPFNTVYGQREFHVIDPDILLISFGEKVGS